MKVGAHSVYYLIDTEEDEEKQRRILDAAFLKFSEKYPITPNCAVAMKLGSKKNSIELHPLIKEGQVDFKLRDLKEGGRLIRFGKEGLDVPLHAVTIKLEKYDYHLFFSNKYLENSFY